jgi:DNA-binding NarL/FixJ family response regulator
VIVLSQHVDIDYALALIQTHPTHSGYLLKDRITQIDILSDAIHRVSRGETIVEPNSSSCCSDASQQRPAGRANPPVSARFSRSLPKG